MSRRKSWEIRSFAACLLLTAACASNTDSETDNQNQTPQTPISGKSGTSTPAAGKTGGSAGTSTTAAAGTGTSSAAGATGSAGAGASVSAVAIIEPFMMAGAATGAAGAGAAGSGTSGAAAGASASAGKSGSGTSGAGGSSTSKAGSGGAGGAGGAGGTGSGAGLVGVTGTATFTKSRIGVDLSIDISAGCVSGKSYPVHIHEGTSCESVATQMGHWGAAATPLPLENAAGSGAAGATGSAAAGSGSAGHSSGGASASTGAAGHDANHAAAGSGAAGTAAGAAGSGTALVLRGEDIPPITCSGVSGKSSTTRSTPDKRLIWTIGTKDETDVVGHVLVVHDTDGSRIGCGKIELK